MVKKLALVLALMATVSVALRSAHGNDQDGPDVPWEGLKVGNELLSLGVADGIPTLDYKGRAVVSSTNTYVTPPFSIMDRWSSAETNAVLQGPPKTPANTDFSRLPTVCATDGATETPDRASPEAAISGKCPKNARIWTCSRCGEVVSNQPMRVLTNQISYTP
jgi:hypothetical protein